MKQLCFNEETVAREIFKSSIPIISGVGHETDFTISDFVADLRAPTPSIAAERAVPKKEDWLYTLEVHADTIKKALQNQIDFKRQFIDSISYKIQSRMKSAIELGKKELRVLSEKLLALNPKKVLKRGYSITLKDNIPIKSSTKVQKQDIIKTILHDGKIISRIEKTQDSD